MDSVLFVPSLGVAAVAWFAPMAKRGMLLSVGLLVVAAMFGCDGVVSAPFGQPNSNTNPSDPSQPQAVVLPPFEPTTTGLRRLTVAQYRNSLEDLLGVGIVVPDDLEPDTALNGFASIGASRITISPSAVEKFEAAAFDLASQAMAPGRRVATVPCEATGVVDRPCTTAFVVSMGKKAWRRPLTASEITRYVNLAEEAAMTLDNFYAGLEFALAGLLQSPNFLYRVELGEPDPDDDSRLRFTSYEMASRLAFLFWNTTPNEQLLDKAAAGELSTKDEVREQAQRMIDFFEVRQTTENFLDELLQLPLLGDLAKNPEAYSVSPTLGASMREEVVRTVQAHVFDWDTDFRDILDSKRTVINAELAQLYGLPVQSGGFYEATIPANSLRAGLMGKAGILSIHAHFNETSPTLRGKFVREVLMCQKVPPPPPDVLTELPEPAPGQVTMRQRLEQHATDPACASCHQYLDPIGLALENFDALGGFRSEEHGEPIDPTGVMGDWTFDDPQQLARLIKGDPKFADCMVRQWYRYATGHVETAGETAVIAGLVDDFSGSGYRLKNLLVALASSDGFRFAATPAAGEETP